jgi:cytochrome P450
MSEPALANPQPSQFPDAIPDELAATLTDPRSFGQVEKVHQAFAWLRRHYPVGKAITATFDPFWVITRHADILGVEQKNDIFSNGARSTTLVPAATLASLQQTTGSPHLTHSLVNMDGAEHRVYRGLTRSWFAPANIKRLTERIRELARTHVDRMLARGGECDFVADVALHYPLHVIMDILGVPEADERRMLLLTQQLFGARDPDLGRSAASMADPKAALGVFQSVLTDFYAYFGQLNEARRKEPREDLATVIANAQIDGKPVDPHLANSYYVLIATAGHDTTSASTSGAIWGLAERPDQWALVKANPALIPGLVDEAIRWVTPVKHFMRTATQDYTLRDKTIKAGDWLMLAYLSGNRDEEVFADPFEFRVNRTPGKHVAFGYGVHVCLGQHLAKLEMSILLEELIARVKTIELAGTPAWTQSTFVSGPKRLPIRFTAE